jgi:hypothetical protein
VQNEVPKAIEPEDDGIVRNATKKSVAMKRNVNPDPDTFGTLTTEERSN